MKAKIELIPEENVEETIIRCHKMTDEIQNIVSYIENEKKIIRYKRGTAYPLNINSIYYFEIVDQNAFVYCEKEIYESKMKLYEFEQETEGTSFFRASKSLINADKIDSIKPFLSMGAQRKPASCTFLYVSWSRRDTAYRRSLLSSGE